MVYCQVDPTLNVAKHSTDCTWCVPNRGRSTLLGMFQVDLLYLVCCQVDVCYMVCCQVDLLYLVCCQVDVCYKVCCQVDLLYLEYVAKQIDFI